MKITKTINSQTFKHSVHLESSLFIYSWIDFIQSGLQMRTITCILLQEMDMFSELREHFYHKSEKKSQNCEKKVRIIQYLTEVSTPLTFL